MADATLTIALNGEVPLDLFADAMVHFKGLVSALTDEISPDVDVVWLVEDLMIGSAQATVRGESSKPEAIEPIPHAFLAVGLALSEGRPVPYSQKVAREAHGLAHILNGKVTSIRFETRDDDATVSSVTDRRTRPRYVSSYGAVDGRVQTLSSRNSLRFTLYDAFHDRAVSCYLQEGGQEMMRDAWDKRAIVEGWVSRDATTGRPITIRRVQHVEVLEDVIPGAMLRAVRGIAPAGDKGQSAVEVIRRLRDA